MVGESLKCEFGFLGRHLLAKDVCLEQTREVYLYVETRSLENRRSLVECCRSGYMELVIVWLRYQESVSLCMIHDSRT